MKITDNLLWHPVACHLVSNAAASTVRHVAHETVEPVTFDTKMIDLWDVTIYSIVTDVSEKPVAFIFRVED
jgi:hypothetical protein